MATIPVIAVARSGDYDLTSHNFSLSLSTAKNAKRELAINLSGRVEFSHCAAGPLHSMILTSSTCGSPVKQVINSGDSGLAVGHDQHYPQWQMSTELVTYQLDKDLEDPEA